MAKENLDPMKTPDTASRQKVSASYIFSSCKKKQSEYNSRLPGHTVLVDDSSDEEFIACDSFKDKTLSDKEDEVVDDSLVEFSLIRKWLQNLEDSFDSEEDITPGSNNYSSDSVKSDPQEKLVSIVQPKTYSAVKDDTIILSSSDDETSLQKIGMLIEYFISIYKRITLIFKSAHQGKSNTAGHPLSSTSPPKSTKEISLKPEPDLCDSFDSHLDSASLKERLARSDQPIIRRKILDSSSDSASAISRPSRQGRVTVLCLSSDEEISSSPQTSPTWEIKPMTRIDSPSMPTAIPESESELEDIFVSLTINDVAPSVKPKKVSKPRQKRKVPPQAPVFLQPDSKSPRSFLASLSSEVPTECRHVDAIPYLKNFRKNRDELTARLFVLFNEKVFKNNLPRDFSITWNSRLTRTAGYCRHFTKRDSGMTSFESRIGTFSFSVINFSYYFVIFFKFLASELSVKVVDTPCRLRDTLVHELCHAATWVIDNCRGGILNKVFKNL